MQGRTVCGTAYDQNRTMIKGVKAAIVICAGGIGERMGAGKPKQFIEMADGTSILRKTVDVFRSGAIRDLADIIVVTAPEGFEKETEALIADTDAQPDTGAAPEKDAQPDTGAAPGKDAQPDIGAAPEVSVITGGAERQDSVRNALRFLSSEGFDDDDIVLIHDGARPHVTADIIMGVAEAAYEKQAAIAAVPVKDTIRDSESGTLDRSRLYSVQTPQGFRFGLIRDAVEQACGEGFYGTDDGSLAERAGVMPEIVQGSYANIKITTPEDLK